MDQEKRPNASETQTRDLPLGGRPGRAAWVKKNNRRLRTLRGAIVVISALTLLLGLLILLLPAFKVKEIVVSGNTVTTDEEIVSASGVTIGDEILGVDLHAVVKGIQDQCYVRVTARLTPSKLILEITERAEMYASVGGSWVSLDRDLNVVQISNDKTDFAGLLRVELPDVSGLCVNQPVLFRNEGIDRSYIGKMLDTLDEMELTEQVDLLDVSEKFNVSYVLNGNLRVVLGSVSDLSVKHELVEQILLANDGGSECAVIDVSDLKKSTYRPVASVELLA